LLLEPDWPRVRRLVAKQLRRTEHEVDRMRERGDSLDKVDLVIAVKDVLGKIHR
jgi:hypothetical protein